ncbi:MAG: TonB-dependent receptor [Myxococcota bacterium]|nr:TonB-dependent receptor [Deltaproteobacteria bacterium]MDQ3340509.1 TonB-dependent receptor [Myxococcota bacterium]
MPSFLDTILGVAAALMHPLDADPAPEPEISDTDLLEEAERLAEEQAKSADETIVIIADAPAESASSVRLTQDQLRYRSRTQPSDFLRNVPGVMVSQHAGGGKADQIFIRGFDADHGTDVAIFADGVPVNLTSHGHGQGYADTHWMIPETIKSVEVHKGPYAARFGDFYTAGAMEFATLDKIEGPTVWVAAGSSATGPGRFDGVDRRLVGMASPSLRKGDRSLIALQVAENDGPYVNPQDFRQGNALVKWADEIGPGTLKLQTTWYMGTWNQSGQLPEREVAAGRLDRFGSLDPTEGGDAMRTSVSASYKAGPAKVMAYGVSNKLDLFSNFTLYADDMENGDQIEQIDDRLLGGFDASYEKRAGNALIAVGVQGRADNVETALYHSVARRRLETKNHTDNRVRNIAAYAEANWMPRSWLHLQPAVRVDRFSWGVDDLEMPGPTREASASIASPKLSAQLHADDTITFFINAGMGFHTNDARSATEPGGKGGKGAIARAVGGEVGFRMKPSAASRVSADVWYLGLSSEQVWSGDAGGTAPSDPTRRFGIDVEGSVDATPWLSLDANVTWAHATFVANRGNGGALALAPRWMGSGGATLKGKTGFIALRARGIGDRPGNDDGSLTADGYLIFDVIAGKQIGSVDLNLTINNALDADWREAQFAEESRVTPTSDVVEQMHYTPGMPLTATMNVAYKW